MRILTLLVILALALGGAVDACADEHVDHSDPGCVGVCCQYVSPASPGLSLLVRPAVCERVLGRTDQLNDDPLARVFFRPPEVA